MAILTGMMPTVAQANIPLLSLDQTHDIPPTFLTLQQTNTVLEPGSVGSEVKDVQSMLVLMGYYSGPVDGNYGESTADAVSQFQTAAGLNSDGVVGPLTWQRLLPSLATLGETTLGETTQTATSDKEPDSTAPGTASPIESFTIATAGSLPILQFEDTGPSVEQLQARLTELNFYSGPLDGIFGAQTEQAVQNFQRQSSIDADGIVGPSTWQRLLQ